MATDIVPLWIALTASLGLIAIIIVVAAFIHKFGRKAAIEHQKKQPFTVQDLVIPPKDFILVRILVDKNDHASLSAFQLLAWTLLIATLYIALWFWNFLNNITAAPPPLPEGLLVLMGISVGVPIANKVIMDYKESKERPEGEEYKEPVFASMLEENGKPSLLRFQMFLWTIASLVIYTWSFFTVAAGVSGPGSLGLPVVDNSLLFLMGLSQTGYLGSKAFAGKVEKDITAGKSLSQPVVQSDSTIARKAAAIHELVPRTANPGDLVTLLGSEFGRNKDTVMIGTERILPDQIKKWESSRIEFVVPGNAAPGKHPLRVIAEGSNAETVLIINDPHFARRQNNIPADIISDIWIDDPSQKGLKVPPIGYFIPNNMYHFFFEFAVPAGTPSWGRTEFQAKFFVNGEEVAERSFMPGHLSGNNYGVFDYTFKDLRDYTIEIRGASSKMMKVTVGKPKRE